VLYAHLILYQNLRLVNNKTSCQIAVNFKHQKMTYVNVKCRTGVSADQTHFDLFSSLKSRVNCRQFPGHLSFISLNRITSIVRENLPYASSISLLILSICRSEKRAKRASGRTGCFFQQVWKFRLRCLSFFRIGLNMVPLPLARENPICFSPYGRSIDFRQVL